MKNKYEQFVDEFQTQVGMLRITTTLVLNDQGTYDFDDRFVVLNGRDLAIPNAWKRQTSNTITRKVCAMVGAK